MSAQEITVLVRGKTSTHLVRAAMASGEGGERVSWQTWEIDRSHDDKAQALCGTWFTPRTFLLCPVKIELCQRCRAKLQRPMMMKCK